MSFFKKILGALTKTSEEEKDPDFDKFTSDNDAPMDEQFIYNFKKNGGKFLYCEDDAEVKHHFENILQENDWFESEAICYNQDYFAMLKENNITYSKPKNPSFIVANCENLIANEGSILFSSKQIKQNKPSELPDNMIIIATISQIIKSKGDGLSAIRQKYKVEYPTNITTIKYFEKVEDEDFTKYGSTPKNLYLLLLEDLIA